MGAGACRASTSWSSSNALAPEASSSPRPSMGSSSTAGLTRCWCKSRRPWTCAASSESRTASCPPCRRGRRSSSAIGGSCRYPKRSYLGLPTRVRPFVTTPLFSWPGKARMALEPLRQRETDRRGRVDRQLHATTASETKRASISPSHCSQGFTPATSIACPSTSCFLGWWKPSVLGACCGRSRG